MKIEDKDWSRMCDLVLSGKDDSVASNSIKDKRKAIARYVCGVKLQGSVPRWSNVCQEYTGYFSEFGNKALSLGATYEEIGSVWDSVEIPAKYVEKLQTLGSKKLNDRFVGSLSKAILDAGFNITYLPCNGWAITESGKEAMERNGRKWTIGYKTEIDFGTKKVKLSFDAITDEGDGPSYYVVDNSSDSDYIFRNLDNYKGVGKLSFVNNVLNVLKMNM